MILRCICENTYQDEEHGVHMRVHNPCKKKDPSGPQPWRCTICLRQQTTSVT